MNKKKPYVKPVIKKVNERPVAGGCGDFSENMCKTMAYRKSGPSCGDFSENMCKQQAYRQ